MVMAKVLLEYNPKHSQVNKQQLQKILNSEVDRFVQNCVIRTTIYDMCSRQLPGCYPDQKWNSVIFRIVIGVEFIFSINRPNQATLILVNNLL